MQFEESLSVKLHNRNSLLKTEVVRCFLNRHYEVLLKVLVLLLFGLHLDIAFVGMIFAGQHLLALL